MTVPSANNAENHEKRPAAATVDRRRFLTMLAGVGAIGAVGCGSGSVGTRGSMGDAAASTATDAVSSSDLPPAMPSTNTPLSDPPPRSMPSAGDRRLVVIELQGGNDGLATLQPYDDTVLRRERPELLTEPGELIDAGGGFGWHPALAGSSEVGLAAVVGVGSDEPDFSHFEMEQRWWRGESGDSSRLTTGFLGRICDQLDVGAPVTGLSFAGGPTPALLAAKAVTVGLGDPGTSWFLAQDDDWSRALRDSYRAMAEPSADDTDRFASARAGLANTVRFADALSGLDSEGETEYPWSDIGQQLRFVAGTMALDQGVRVLHARHGGFDTHSGQQWRHRDLLAELDEAVVSFVADLRRRDLWDDTLIVTTSEFGRRVPMNDQGTDHGGASTMMIWGAGRSGVHGVAPDLRNLDDGNLVATARFEDYYATIAQDWFGIDPGNVLPSDGTVITGLL